MIVRVLKWRSCAQHSTPISTATEAVDWGFLIRRRGQRLHTTRDNLGVLLA